jgi:hypothetical protein
MVIETYSGGNKEAPGYSTSIWGDIDLLNTWHSSSDLSPRIISAVDEIQQENGLFIGIRMLVDEERLPVLVYESNPNRMVLSFEEHSVMPAGPWSRSEAIAIAYLLSSASYYENTLRGVTEVEEYDVPQQIVDLVGTVGGNPLYIAAGIYSVCDLMGRMTHYRDIRDSFEDLDLEEDNLLDMHLIIGIGAVPAAKAFMMDGYIFGDSFQKTVEQGYAAERFYVLPFFQTNPPQTEGDWEMKRIGMVTGYRLFKRIESFLRQA